MKSITIRNSKLDETLEISIRNTVVWGKRKIKRVPQSKHVPALWIASAKMPIDSTSKLYERVVYNIPVLVFDTKSSDNLSVDIDIGESMGAMRVAGTVIAPADDKCTLPFSVSEILGNLRDYAVIDAIVVIMASDKLYTFNLMEAKIKLKKDRTIKVHGAFSLNDSLDIDGFCKSFETNASIVKHDSGLSLDTTYFLD